MIRGMTRASILFVDDDRELVHMLTHSARHGREGVFEPALSGKQLIAPTLPLAAMDVDRLMPGFEGEQ